MLSRRYTPLQTALASSSGKKMGPLARRGACARAPAHRRRSKRPPPRALRRLLAARRARRWPSEKEARIPHLREKGITRSERGEEGRRRSETERERGEKTRFYLRKARTHRPVRLYYYFGRDSVPGRQTTYQSHHHRSSPPLPSLRSNDGRVCVTTSYHVRGPAYS